MRTLKRQQAMCFAVAAHEAIGQKRGDGDPYWHHPQRVAEVVHNFCAGEGMIEEMYCAAWLHDVVEDTRVKKATISEIFGPRIAAFVGWVTDDKSLKGKPNWSRADRKLQSRWRLHNAPREAQLIKLADIHDNLGGDRGANEFEHYPQPGYVSRYLWEKREVISRLTKTAGHPLRVKVGMLLENAIHQWGCVDPASKKARN